MIIVVLMVVIVIVMVMVMVIVIVVFKSSIWRNGPSPWEIWTLKGHFEVRVVGNGSESLAYLTSSWFRLWDPYLDLGNGSASLAYLKFSHVMLRPQFEALRI